MTKVGVIGTGFGKDVASAFNSFSNSRVIAVAGQNEKKTADFAKKINAKYFYLSWRELINNPEVDLVCIATPQNLHKEMLEYAVSKNKHILVEKPAGVTPQEISDMVNLTKDYPKHIFVDHAYRFHPIVAKIKKLIEAGEIGKVNAIQVSVYMNYYSNENDQYTWWHNQKNNGDYKFVIGVHMIDLARYIVGMKKMLEGKIINTVIPDTKYPTQPTSAAQFSAQYQMEDQISLQLFSTAYSFGYKNTEIKIIGNKGVILYDDLDGLKTSQNNNQTLQKIEIEDHLKHIDIGRSIWSRSTKFMAEAYIDLLNGKNVDTNQFCNLEEAKINLEYLFWD